MLQSIKEAYGNELTLLSGSVKVDEAYIGGREANKHEGRKFKAGPRSSWKTGGIGTAGEARQRCRLAD